MNTNSSCMEQSNDSIIVVTFANMWLHTCSESIETISEEARPRSGIRNCKYVLKLCAILHGRNLIWSGVNGGKPRRKRPQSVLERSKRRKASSGAKKTDAICSEAEKTTEKLF
jgi:hypothetical protein